MNIGFSRLSAIVVALCCAACEPTRPGTGLASLRYELDAPLCSSTLPVAFYVDSVLVGQDTFRVNLEPEHLLSPLYPISIGTHRLGARVVGGYTWTDTIVTFTAGASFTRVLPFYCS